MSTEVLPRLRLGRHWFSRGDNFPCYPLVQSIFILLYNIVITGNIDADLKTRYSVLNWSVVRQTPRTQVLTTPEDRSLNQNKMM